MTKVFVYGTLVPKEADATHRVQDYNMYNAGPYPYIRPGAGTVFGTVIEVTEDDLVRLDRYEGIDRGLYSRERVTATRLDDSGEDDVYVYVGTDQWPTLIPDGNWLNREANGT